MRFTEDFVLKVEDEIKMEDIVMEKETFIRPSKIEVRGRDEVDNHEDEQEKEKRQKLEGGGGGGGLLDNFLSKLTSPRPTKGSEEDHAFEVNNDHNENGDDRVRGDGGGDGEGKGGGGGGGEGEGRGGGVINNLISNLFHKSSEGDGENVKNNDGNEEKLEGRNEENEVIKKVDEESEGGSINSNGGSLISNLVQDVAAPEGDEASILIQSIVHD